MCGGSLQNLTIAAKMPLFITIAAGDVLGILGFWTVSRNVFSRVTVAALALFYIGTIFAY